MSGTTATNVPKCCHARMYAIGCGTALCLALGLASDVTPGKDRCTPDCPSYGALPWGEEPPVYRPAGKISWPGHTRTIGNPSFGWDGDDAIPARGNR
jgi:hypothetical protein